MKDDRHLHCVQLHACMSDLFVPIKVEFYDSVTGSLRSSASGATSAHTGLQVQLLQEAMAPTRQEVLQQL